MNLNQITISTSNVDRLLTFYQLLGLRLIVDSAPRYVRLECPDGESTLSLHHVDGLPAGGRITLYFETMKLDEEVNRLQELDIDFDLLPTDQRWLWREAHVRDPDGNNIILFHAAENRRNPPWRVR